MPDNIKSARDRIVADAAARSHGHWLDFGLDGHREMTLFQELHVEVARLRRQRRDDLGSLSPIIDRLKTRAFEAAEKITSDYLDKRRNLSLVEFLKQDFRQASLALNLMADPYRTNYMRNVRYSMSAIIALKYDAIFYQLSSTRSDAEADHVHERYGWKLARDIHWQMVDGRDNQLEMAKRDFGESFEMPDQDYVEAIAAHGDRGLPRLPQESGSRPSLY